MLELRGVTKRFGRQLALDDLTLCVRRGDCYGFIGHNGSGKTTAMRVALGLLRPDRGQVLVDGFDARRHPREARARLGGLIEVPGFYGSWSGARNLEELARLQGLPRAAARSEAGRWLERVGLAGAGAKHVQHYSHGMRQRLGIAQALLGSPACVLLDEPTNGLDPEGIAEVRTLLRALAREQQCTFLISSHQLHEIAGLCNRIGVLRAGRLLVEEQTRALLAEGSGSYELRSDDLQGAARALGALGLEHRPAGESGLWRIALGARAPQDVTRALVEAGVPLSSFAPRATSLEEIYLRHTHAQPRDAARPARSALPADRDAAAPAAAPAELRAPRHGWARVLAFELRRYARSLGAWPWLLAPLGLAAAAMLRRAAQAAQDRTGVEERSLFSATGVTAFEATGLALQAGLPLLVLLLVGLGSQSIAAEHARGTLRNLLLRPMTRGAAALGKALALLSATLAGYLILAAGALALSGALFDFGDVTETLPNGQAYVLTPAAQLWPELRRALLSPLLPLAAFAGLGFLCGALVRSGAGALALALGALLFLDLGRTLTRAFGLDGLLPTDHLPSPLSDTSFVRFYVDVAQGISNARFEHAGSAVYTPLTWALAAFALGALLLARRRVP